MINGNWAAFLFHAKLSMKIVLFVQYGVDKVPKFVDNCQNLPFFCNINKNSMYFV